MTMNRRQILTGAAVTGAAVLLPASVKAATVHTDHLSFTDAEQAALVRALDHPYVLDEGQPNETTYYRVVAAQSVRRSLREANVAFLSAGPPSNLLPGGVYLHPHGVELALCLRQAFDLLNADL